MILKLWKNTGAALVAMSIVCGTAMAQETSRSTSVILYPGSATVERSARVRAG